MEWGKLSNVAIDCAMSWLLQPSPGSKAGSSASSSDSFVSFVSFVVKQFSASARALAFDPFSLLTRSKRAGTDNSGQDRSGSQSYSRSRGSTIYRISFFVFFVVNSWHWHYVNPVCSYNDLSAIRTLEDYTLQKRKKVDGDSRTEERAAYDIERIVLAHIHTRE